MAAAPNARNIGRNTAKADTYVCIYYKLYIVACKPNCYFMWKKMIINVPNEGTKKVAVFYPNIVPFIVIISIRFCVLPAAIIIIYYFDYPITILSYNY